MATSKLILDIIAKDNASATLKRLGLAADGSVNKMEMLNRASRAASVGLAAWTAVAVLSVKAAAEESAEQARLAQTLEAATGATAEQSAATDEMLTQMGLATGVADDQLRPALSKLALATGDLEQSQELLTVALDASVALGKDVETVAVALGKAYNGNVGALGRLGIATKDTEGNTLTFAQVMDDLKEKTEGAAAAAGENAPWARLQVAVEEAQESIGGALLPAVKAASDALTKMGPGAIQAAFLITGVGLAAIKITAAALNAKKALDAMNISMKAAATTAAPWGIAVVALTAAVVDYASKQARANAAVDAYTASLDTNTGAVGDNTAAQVSSNLEDLGVLAALDDANVSYDDLTDAVLKGRAGVEEWALAHREALPLIISTEDGTLGLVEVLATEADRLNEAKSSWERTNTATATGAGTMEEAASSADKTAAMMDKLADKIDLASDKWERYIGLPLSAAEAEIGYRDAVKATIDAINDETKTRDEKRTAVISEIRAAEDLRLAEIENGMSVKDANEIYNDHIAKLRETAREAGILGGKTDELSAALRRLPRQLEIGVVLTTNPNADEIVITTPAGNRRVLSAAALAGGGYARAAGGTYLVGEYGPEMLTLNASGGRVHPHSQSMRPTGGGDTIVNIHGVVDKIGAAREVRKVLLELKRIDGGAPLGLA